MSEFWKKIGKAVLGGAVLCAAFCGCDNFLAGGNVKNELEELIEIANTPAVTYYVTADKDSGTVTPSQLRGKKKETFDIMFTPSDNWKFLNWEVLDRTTGELVTDALSFANETKLETKVTIINPKENLTIHPKCILVPVVAEIYPPYYPTGYNQDTLVKITFNKPVDPQSFGQFGCISFTSGAADITDCYGKPYFSSDYKVLYIPAAVDKHILADDDPRTAAEVTLRLNCANLKDAEGMALTQNEPYTYCVNKNVDSVDPTITALAVTTTDDKNAWYYRSLTDKPFEQWSDEEVKEADGTTVKYFYGDFSQNHVGKSVHISLQGYDNADAVAGVFIREVYEKDANGNNASENEQTAFISSFEPVTDANGQIVKTSDGKTLYSFDFDYEFQTRADGLVLLEISLKDSANRGDTQSYEVIKQSETNKFVQFRLEVDGKGVLPELLDGEYKSHISANSFLINTNEKSYCDYLSATKKFSLFFYDKNDVPSEVFKVENFVITNDEPSHHDNSFTEDFNQALQNVYIDSYRDTKAKTVFYEETGIVKEYDFIIPAGPESYLGWSDHLANSIGVYDYDEGKGLYVTYQETMDSPVSHEWVEFYNNIESLNNIIDYTYRRDDVYVGLEGIYKIYLRQEVVLDSLLNISITSGYGKPAVINKTETNRGGVPDLNLAFSIKNITYEKSTGMATVEFNVDYPDDGKNYFINAQYNRPERYYSKPNEKKITIPAGRSYTFRIMKADSVYGLEGVTPYTSEIIKNLDGGGDLWPPYIYTKLFSYYDSSYFYIENVTVKDDTSYTNWSDYQDIEDFVCYYCKTNLGTYPDYDTLERMNIAKKTIKFEEDPERSGKLCAKIPFSDVEQGEYYLYSYLEDAVGNGKAELLAQDNCDRSGMVCGIHFYLNDKTPIVQRIADKNLKVMLPEGESGKINRFRLEQKNGKWVWENFDGTYYTYFDNTNDYEYNNEPQTKNHFMKVTAYGYYPKYGGSYHLKPLYYYPNYINGDTICTSKAWMKVSNGWQIFCDAPVFCHTLYSTRKITSTASAQDALEWEAQAQETGLVVNDSTENRSFTYANVNLEGVPAGNWYTTICHFADGTVLMSEVQKK